LTHELVEFNHGTEDLVLLGIVTRGKSLAERVAKLLQELEGKQVPQGYVDVTLYRDDTGQTFKPASESLVPVELTGKKVVLIDDVVYSGRSVRAALDALNGYGRPASVQLMVLLDRGHRELPIRPDFVGKNIPTSKQERVFVQLREVDGTDRILLRK
ncbi:MAG: Pyrimidine operon attenuation protein/uracil phosphoribosyltransferase, partial [Vampirovibrio sp.]|nr:Pyrimidine operon attenuation protein/uracil phosphoribosyltransferase [Vampirovibrio sp.]